MKHGIGFNNSFIFDCEGDGLYPSKFYCLTYYDLTTKESNTLLTHEEIKTFLLSADRLIGHNICRWDIPHLERVLKIKIEAELVDTLALSWYLRPERNRHGLESYGDDFGVPKPVIKDWHNQNLDDYIHRCQEDVKINTELFIQQWIKLLRIYDHPDDARRLIKYLTFKLKCAQLQEKSGWPVDLEFTKKALEKLLKEKTEKFDSLAEVMPKVPVIVRKQTPKKPLKKDGSLSRIGQEWFQLLEKNNLPQDTEELDVIVEYNTANPGSTQQVKDWLFTFGWVPETIDYKKNKETGETREVPQISKKNGGGICDSIKKLYDKEPRLELLDGLYTINHRIGILSGFIRDVDQNGLIRARVSGLTNTLRFQHAEIVNLPKVNRPYGYEVRGSLVAPDGYELCGADMSSLEDRLKQHYIFPLDPDYVDTMLGDDYDPHLLLAVTSKKITLDDKKFYQSFNPDTATDSEKSRYKQIKKQRDVHKNGVYSMQYGAYPPKIAQTCNISLEEAKKLFNAYWKLNWAIKEVSESLSVKTVDDEKWLYNPVSKYWYNLRKENDRFSTLVQGTAAYVFDLWVAFVLKDREQITGQFHDEIILCVKKGFREKVEKYLTDAIDKTNSVLKLNRVLSIGIQFGENYAKIH